MGEEIAFKNEKILGGGKPFLKMKNFLVRESLLKTKKYWVRKTVFKNEKFFGEGKFEAESVFHLMCYNFTKPSPIMLKNFLDFFQKSVDRMILI